MLAGYRDEVRAVMALVHVLILEVLCLCVRTRMGGCVMNKICWMFEREFDGFIGKASSANTFDYTILKSGAEYPPALRSTIQHLYDEYNNRLHNYMQFSKYERIDEDAVYSTIYGIREEFRRGCERVCSNEAELCDILLDICYHKSTTKSFVWSMCANTIVNNLLAKNGNKISAPVRDEDGDIEFGGDMFSIITKEIGGAVW